MKPKILCSHCNALLHWNDATCPSCGASVEWPAVSSSVPAAERNPAKAKRATAGPGKNGMKSWVVGTVAVAAVAVFIVAVMTENRPSSTEPQAVPGTSVAPGMQQGPPVPSMEMMNQISLLESQVKANPGDLDALLTLANTLHDARLFDRAVAQYRVYLAKKPANANARVDMGICMHEMGQSRDALVEMKRALKDEPRHLQAHFNLGVISLSLGDVQEANVWFKKTVDLAPGSEIGQRAQQMLSQHNPQSFQ